MTFELPPLPSKRVYIEIIGGDADGFFLDSRGDDLHARKIVDFILLATNNGEVGKGIKGASLTHLLEPSAGVDKLLRTPDFMHQYFVTELIEEDEEILIRMEYQARKLERPKPKPEQP